MEVSWRVRGLRALDSGEEEERKHTAASAQSVRLVVALAERAGTLRCCRWSATVTTEIVCSAVDVLILDQVACNTGSAISYSQVSEGAAYSHAMDVLLSSIR